MTKAMNHGDVCWVKPPSGKICLARFVAQGALPGYWEFFGTDLTLDVDKVKFITEAGVRDTT